MVTATQPAPASKAIAKPTENTFSYVPLGESEAITLTIARVRQYLCTPTKSGKLPSDDDVVKFIMLCKAQGLNPWLKDAYLVGYDSNEGPTFSLITSHQAFLKRAEASRDFQGMESGVVVQMPNSTLEYRPGDLVLDGEKLVGGWAKVYRADRTIPSSDTLKLSTYNTNRSRWRDDPAGMIVKCAEASALRKAFPSNLAGLVCREEMDRTITVQATTVASGEPPTAATKSESIAGMLQQRMVASNPVAPNQESVPQQASETSSEPLTGTSSDSSTEQPVDSPPGQSADNADEVAPTLQSLLDRVATSTRVSELHEINDIAKKFLSAAEFEQLGLALQEHKELIESQKQETVKGKKPNGGKLL